MGTRTENNVREKNNPDLDFESEVKVKIAYVVEKFPSPTEYFILNEILELEKNGFELYVLVLRKQKKYLDIPEIKKLKSPVIYLPRVLLFLPLLSFLIFSLPAFRFSFLSSWKSIPKSFISFFKQLRNHGINLFFASVIRNKGIDHIHAHFAFIASEIACLLSEQLGTKFSFTAHAQDIYTNPKHKLIRLIQEASFVVTCTKYNREYLYKIIGYKNNNKLFTVYHAIDSSKWGKSSSSQREAFPQIRILSVGRLVEKKGLFFLLKAFKLLIGEGARVRCTIIGEGPLQKQLRSYIREMKLHNYIDLLDFVPQSEIRRHLINTNIFVLPSIIAENGDRDGLPNVLLEAMGMGVPVISTPVSAIPELIEDRKTGLLVKEKDERALANAISELANNRELCNRISENSRRKILVEFSIEKSTEKLATIFRSNIEK